MNLSEPQLQLFGLLMVFFAVLTLGFNFIFGILVKDARENVRQPIMEMEFVRKVKDVRAITGDKPGAKDGLRTFLLFDSFGFIPLYLFFLLVMSFFLSEGGAFVWMKQAAAAAVLLAVAGTAADYAENYFSLQALGEPAEADAEKSYAAVWWAAHVKWIAIFAATGILSLLFWRGGYFWNFITVVLLLASLGGIVCICIPALRPAVALAMGAQILIMLALGLGFATSATFRGSFLPGT